MARFIALLASLRIANAPSVVSNVWLGCMLGYFYWGGFGYGEGGMPKLILSGLCLLFAGNLANDWFDRKWDADHRPERALPSGVFHPYTYLIGFIALAILGVTLAGWVAQPAAYVAVGILAMIAIYTWLHKHTRWAVIPMGLCRAGLYLMGFIVGWLEAIGYQDEILATSPPSTRMNFDNSIAWLFIVTHALGMLIYIAGLSLAARYESVDEPPHGMVLLSRAMLCLPLAAMSAWWMAWYPVPTVLGMLPFAAWLILSLTRFRSPVPVFVSALLAGIPLIDLIAALPLAISLIAPDLTLFDSPRLLATVLVPVGAFLLGRLLQRVAPAT